MFQAIMNFQIENMLLWIVKHLNIAHCMQQTMQYIISQYTMATAPQID